MTTFQNTTIASLLCAGFLATSAALASEDPSMDADVQHLYKEWARIRYQVTDPDKQFKQIDALARDAENVVGRYPGQTKPLLWQGIVLSEEAAMAGVLHQLHYVKEAREVFEQAQAIDPNAENGAVEMSLGVIYYRVPGFPVAFGDHKKARRFLEEALVKDSDGLDANFFYGDFLVEEGEYQNARKVLVHALDAPVNSDRPVWDAGRRQEVLQLIKKCDKKLDKDAGY